MVDKDFRGVTFSHFFVKEVSTIPLIKSAVKLKSLAVDRALIGSFIVSDDISFSVKEKDIGIRLNITAEMFVRLFVTKDGRNVTATNTPLFLFSGNVLGDVPNLHGAVCGNVTYWAYTAIGSVPCVCWVDGNSLSGGYAANWCGREFMLGVRKSMLVFDDDTDFIHNGIVFGTDNVTLTSNRSEYIITQRDLNAPDALVVGSGTTLIVETVIAGHVLVINTLETRNTTTKTTRIIQRGDSLDVSIKRLNGHLILEGGAVNASIGGCTPGSAVTIDGTASLSSACAIYIYATDHSFVGFHDISGVLIGSLSSMFSFSATENADLVVVGNRCGVSFTSNDELFKRVTFVENALCKGRSKLSDAQHSVLDQMRSSALYATMMLLSGRCVT